MFRLSVTKHKSTLKQAFSECFVPVKDELGNVPVSMQKSKVVTASILGVCRGYGEGRIFHEPDFELIVDAVFEEVFRRESLEVQTLTEFWFQNGDEEFMKYYYQAKNKAIISGDLRWLQKIALEYFKPAQVVVFPL